MTDDSDLINYIEYFSKHDVEVGMK